MDGEFTWEQSDEMNELGELQVERVCVMMWFGWSEKEKVKERSWLMRRHGLCQSEGGFTQSVRPSASQSVQSGRATEWTSTHHQLAVLSIGWAAFSHPALDPTLTNIVPQSTIFGCWPLAFFSFFFFSTLASILPSHLAILSTLLLPDLHLALPTN